MLVSKIIENKGKTVVTVTEESSVFETVKRLDETKAGAALVVNKKEELVGIVSERDILYKCYKMGRPLDGTNLIKDLMTPANDLIVGKMEDNSMEIMNAIIIKHIRHIPILERDTIVSIISIEDVLRSVLEDSESEAKLLREYIKNPFGVHIYKT